MVFGLFDTGCGKDERIEFSNNGFINGTYEGTRLTWRDCKPLDHFCNPIFKVNQTSRFMRHSFSMNRNLFFFIHHTGRCTIFRSGVAWVENRNKRKNAHKDQIL